MTAGVGGVSALLLALWGLPGLLLHTTEPEAPRTWITVSAELSIDPSGVVEVISDWQRCVSNDEGETCDEPA